MGEHWIFRLRTACHRTEIKGRALAIKSTRLCRDP
jgi:hypothetical protein